VLLLSAHGVTPAEVESRNALATLTLDVAHFEVLQAEQMEMVNNCSNLISQTHPALPGIGIYMLQHLVKALIH